MSTAPQTVRVSSDNQSMWQSGEAETLDWVEYIPIIGGEITQYDVKSATLASGTGKVTIDDGRIKYDSEGTYDYLARDVEDMFTITYVVVDDAGVEETKTAQIKVIGGASEAVFQHVDSGNEGAGSISFSAMTAADLLQDVHNFEQLVPVDIDFDAAESLSGAINDAKAALQAEVNRNQENLDEAEDELALLVADRDRAFDKEEHILTYTGKSAELALDLTAYYAAEAASSAINELVGLYRAAEVEKGLAEVAKAAALTAYNVAYAANRTAVEALNVADYALNGANGAVSLARKAITDKDGAIDGIESALNGAKDVLADVVAVIDDVGDWLGNLVGDVAYYAELATYESAKTLAYGYAWIDDSDYKYWVNKISTLKSQKSAYDKAVASRSSKQSDVDKFADDLRKANIELDALKDALDDTFNDATRAFNVAQDKVDDAQKDLDDALDDWRVENQRLNDAIDDVADKLKEYTDAGGDAAKAALEKATDDAYTAYFDTYYEREDALNAMRDDGFFLNDRPDLADLAIATADLAAAQALVTAKDIEIFGTEGYAAILELSQTAFNTLTDSNLKAEVEVKVDSYMQAGLLIDFAMDGGSVDTDIDFMLTSNAAYDVVSNTFTIAPTITNDTTGESIAFETASPNITFFAGLAYNAGATFEFLTDIYAKFASIEILDFPDGNAPATFTETVQLDGIVPLIDFDSTDFGLEFSPPGFLGDIISFEFNSPSIQTEGKETDFDAAFYEDVTGTSLDQIAEVILDLIDLRLEYGEEFKKILAENGASTELFGDDLGTAIVDALEAVLESIGGDYDEDGDGYVPILVIEQRSDGSLLHINSISDDLSGLDDPNKGEFGFFVAQGKSDNIFQVNLDVDQLIATVINVALGNTPESTINPLDLSLNLFDLFESSDKNDDDKTESEKDADKEETKEGIDAIKEYFNLEFGFELADLDIRAGAGFRQDFALSIDDVAYTVVFEDGTTGEFSANGAGEIVFEDASDLVDTNNNGQIDYTLGLTPTAEFFNDTEVALNVGYTLDLLKAHLDFTAGLPFLDVGYETSLSFGPLLRLDGEVDLLSMDVFEDRFGFNAGTAEVAGSFVVAEEAVVEGTSGRDVLVGDEFDNRISGEVGNDVLIGLAGRDQLDGGLGDDVLIGDVLPVHHFADTAAQIYRLYQATLDRAPDANGHQNWTTRLATDEITLLQAANGFVNSAEFQTAYGDLANTDFVELLYENVLDRAADDTGLGSWVDRLEGGTSRAQVVLGFSNSKEFKNNTNADANEFAQGNTQQIWTDDVFRLYQATLNRTPDSLGMMNWSERLGSGVDYLDVAKGFVGSREFQKRFGDDLNSSDFVELLYQNVLGREADVAGLARWTGDLDDGAARVEVVQGFAQSSEFRSKTSDLLEDWMRSSAAGDKLSGGIGDDVKIGGFGADIFVFEKLDVGNDTVMDLEAWDTIDISDFEFSELSVAQAAFFQDNADVVFTAGDVNVLFKDVSLSIFDEDMLLI
ncbi:DUF4214 domain-containing protein [Octadecabacter sp. CECT 8868]|uniref:DUF4214 domain-containing protein n=1 Tax=Octadecabacter algicola TaxID=2909342 RepID=UPI001F2F91BF|nr:DUF4214 domain-containing protein [Octadecabacter algicola]MCF2903825.1 DUF4214 domain-containing protein [Octadecabacter algicola]